MSDRDGAPRTHNVQSLQRGLAILETLNLHNGANLNRVAKLTGLTRGTVYRMLETLRTLGYLRKDPRAGQYWLEHKVRGLADGFADEAWVWDIAKPRMDALSRQIVWPVSIVTPSGITMLIRATTDYDSPLTMQHVPVGWRMPMVGGAAGRVYLAFSSPDQREILIDLVARSSQDNRDALVHDRKALGQMLTETRKRGYAMVESSHRVTAFAVPVMTPRHVIGALVMRYYTSAMKQSEVATKFLPALNAAATEIAEAFEALQPRRS
jgi:IclR family mhp operon transcriptional activator